MLSFIEVSFLVGQMDHYARLTLSAFAIPPAGHRCRRRHYCGSSVLHLLRHFLAAAKQSRDRSHEDESDWPSCFHEAASINAHFVRRFNAKLFVFGGSSSPLLDAKNGGGAALILTSPAERPIHLTFDASASRKYARFMATLTQPPSSSPKERTTRTVQPPVNLENWIEENRDKFKPPVSNRYLYDGRDFFVMVIKGPNARNDFHLVDSEEYFYQLKGDITVRVREGGRIIDHVVREGETFFIPPNVPHSPQRPPETIGVVVERRRPPGEKEHVIFYCENCGALVDDIHFDCKDIVEHFSQAMLDFWNDDKRRTCKKCGAKVEKAPPMKPFK